MAYFIHQNRGHWHWQFIGSDGILYPPDRGQVIGIEITDGILYPADRGQIIGIEISDGILYPPE